MKNILIYTKAIMVLGFILLFACNNDNELIIDTKPVAAFKINETIVDEGTPIIFTDLSFDQNGTISSWNWDFGNNETSTEQSPIYTYPSIGDYKITLTVTDDSGNTNVNIFSKEISVIEPSTASVSPNVLWSYTVPWYSTNSSIAVSNDETVYVTTDAKSSDPARGDNIIAVKNGNVLWGHVTSEVLRSSPAIASDGTVYAGDYNGNFVAVNTDGSIKWEVDLGSRIKYSSPAIANDGTIYIGMEGDNVLHAVNPNDGSIKWSFAVGNYIRATPVVDSSGVIYVASADDYFYAINPDGTEKWKTIYGDYTAGTPAIAESVNTIYFSGKTSDNTGHLIAFNMSDGTIKWDNNSRLLAKTEQGGPVVATDGTIYLGGEDNKMIAYNPDGTEKWSFETLDRILAAPALDNDGNLYFGDTSGTFYVIDSEGETKWKQTKLDEDIRSSAAIGNNGVIYILTRNNTDKTGTIYALRTNATSLMNSEWPMLSQNGKHTGRY